MRYKTVLLMILCALAGGLVARLLPLSQTETIRAERLIIADPVSQSTAELGLRAGDLVLSFRDGNGVVRVEVGTSAGTHKPHFVMRGEDEVERLTIRLANEGHRPFITFRDEFRERMLLGFNPQVGSSPQGEDFWALQFTAASRISSRDLVAAIGMGPRIVRLPLNGSSPVKHEYRGVVAVRNLGGAEQAVVPPNEDGIGRGGGAPPQRVP